MVTETQRAQINAKFDKQERLNAAMYRGSATQNYAHAMTSYFPRLESHLRTRNDREELARASESRKQLEAWAVKRGVDGNRLWKDFLAHQLRIDGQGELPKETELKRWELAWGRLCEDEGGADGASNVREKAMANMTEFRREVPAMAHRTTQSFSEYDVVKFFADVPATPKEEPAK